MESQEVRHPDRDCGDYDGKRSGGGEDGRPQGPTPPRPHPARPYDIRPGVPIPTVCAIRRIVYRRGEGGVDGGGRPLWSPVLIIWIIADGGCWCMNMPVWPLWSPVLIIWIIAGFGPVVAGVCICRGWPCDRRCMHMSGLAL